jgi:hypothetical protein
MVESPVELVQPVLNIIVEASEGNIDFRILNDQIVSQTFAKQANQGALCSNLDLEMLRSLERAVCHRRNSKLLSSIRESPG